MKKILFITLIISLLVACKNNTKNNSIQTKNNDTLIGLISRTNFLDPPYNQWFADEYQKYELDTTTLAQIKNFKNIGNYKIVIVMGTWCPDSRREVPRFYKIVDYLEIDPNNIKMYAVKRGDFSKAGKFDLSKYNIQRIPTFIFFVNGVEKGRIIEKPKQSLEKDMVAILK